MEEFDRVLGGGIVPSSLVLIGGEPGIGKSTLILQIASAFKKKTLYISGEESGSQIKMRLERLGLIGENIHYLSETHIESICATIAHEKPELVIIDSVQTVYSDATAAEAGSLTQVRLAAVKFLETAKNSRTAILLIGHITKEGVVAGPKTLEHLVDTVAYLEGDRYHTYRILRTIKNRFGSTSEIGVFEMTSMGLMPVENPSLLFVELRNQKIPGTVLAPILEGTRIFMAEVQALVTKISFGYPQRKSQGFDSQRLSLLIAVLQKRAHLPLSEYDIHVNVAGGLKISEPACDLPVSLAIATAFKNISLSPDIAVFGEIGLGGEIRKVNQTEKRISEAKKLGFKKIIMPHATTAEQNSCKIITVNTINEAIEKIT